MKRIALILAASILILACNQSEDKEIGTVESVNPDAVKRDTATTAPNVTTPAATPNSNPDTSAQTTAAPAATTLTNFWALESVDGKLLAPSEFPNGTPYFELNVKKNKISGHVGCNGVNGSIKVEGNNITFSKMVTTKSTCPAQAFENKYLKDLSGKTLPYRIEDIRLILIAGPNSQYVYRKMQ